MATHDRLAQRGLSAGRIGRMASFFATLAAFPSQALAAAESTARPVDLHADDKNDGVYDRFDGDLDLGLALGSELGSSGTAPALRATAHYFSIAGLYLGGRVDVGDGSARSLLDGGVDLRPLFLPRWAKGYETGPGWFDLTLDSLSLSLGAFSARRPVGARSADAGFEAGFGLAVPLLGSAAGPWIEARGTLRYPDHAPHEEAVFVGLSWHGFVTTPFTSAE